MNLLFKKLLSLTMLSSMLLTFSFGSFAAEVFTLQDLKEEVLAENLDIKIQYEKYYQSQKNVRNNLGQFLPNLSPQLLFWNTTYGILYTVSPNPSSWFQYRGSNEMAMAEKYVSESIKLNILRDLTLSYVSIKHQEKILASLEAQEPNLIAAHEEALRSEELGLGDPADTFLANRKLMQHQQQILMLKSAIAIQKEGLLLAINKTPNDDIELGELPADHGAMLPENLESAIELGLRNAPELTAHEFMAQGAQYMVAGAKWSFLSFSGIGFGYPSALAIERSKAKEIELKKEQIKNKIENQIALAYEQMRILEERIEIQREVVAVTEENLIRITELHQGAQVPYSEVLKAEDSLYQEHRTLTKLKMEKMLQISEAKRLVGLDATANGQEEIVIEPASLTVEVDGAGFGRKKVAVNLDLDEILKEQVVSVVYGGDIFDYRITSKNFYLYTKTKAKGEKSVTATILLANGQKIELKTQVKL